MKSISLIGGLLSIASIASAGPAGSAGCGKPLPKAQGKGGDYPTNFTTSDGTARKYIIHIPSNYDQDKPVPVIFSFHGRTKTAEEQQGLSQFSNEDWNPDAIAVYPQGLDVSVIISYYYVNVWLTITQRNNGKEIRNQKALTTSPSPWKC